VLLDMDEGFGGVLKRLNLKVTPRRLAVLDVMAGEGTFLSAEQVWTRVKERTMRVGLPTVYRILEELAEGSLLARVFQDNRRLYYYCRNEHHHHHFVCVSCRKVEDIDLCVMDGLEKEVSERIKGTVFSHILQIEGLCRACTERSAGK
jgi:Fe2+ or Zn2+ uptake regulation protein